MELISSALTARGLLPHRAHYSAFQSQVRSVPSAVGDTSCSSRADRLEYDLQPRALRILRRQLDHYLLALDPPAGI